MSENLSPLFWFWKKRTSTIVASKILIKVGEGILTIGKDNAEEFNKGYGAAILHRLKADFQGKVIFLNVEPLDVQAENYEQRIRRVDFYHRNGFEPTNYYIFDNDDRYLILCSDRQFPIEDYRNALKSLSFGLYTAKIEVIR